MTVAVREPQFYESRASAVGLVLMSGVAIFGLSLALQVLAWELRPLLYARFEWREGDLPWMTAIFVDLFGYRPDGYLTFVVWWLWWPMVGALGYCSVRYREPRDFGAAFLHGFVWCWMIVALFISIVLFICSMPFVIMLAEIHEPPAVASVVVPISWCIPACTAMAIAVTWWRCRKLTSRAECGE